MSLIGQRVTVVGAGIGGLAAALACAQRGAQVTVLEQAEAIREVGAGLQISPNGVAVLRALGLDGALARTSVRGQAVSLRNHADSREVTRLDLTTLPDDQSYFFAHRADLVDLLAEAARAAGVTIRLLQKVDRVEDGETPRLMLANCDACGGDLVIAADGLHSCARPMLNGAREPFFTGQVAWRAVVPNTRNHPPEARVHMGPHRHLVSYPLRDGSAVNLVAVQERSLWADEGWHHADNPANLRAAFADFAPPVRDLLASVDQVALWGLFRHPVAERWHGTSVALLGDAAHPTLPFLAQGANMALEDAWVLAASLGATESAQAGLALYQHRRRARVARVIDTASRNAWRYHLSFPPLRFAAHTVLRVAGGLAPGRMLKQFDWLYRYDAPSLFP